MNIPREKKWTSREKIDFLKEKMKFPREKFISREKKSGFPEREKIDFLRKKLISQEFCLQFLTTLTISDNFDNF